MNKGKPFTRRESLRIMGAAGAASFLNVGDPLSFLPGWSKHASQSVKQDFLQRIIKPSLFEAAPIPIPFSKDIAEVACVGRPALTEGPFFVDEKLNRSDIRTDPSNNTTKAGTKLTIKFNIYRTTGSTCTPLSGAYVDIWHCDASGGYSDVSGQGNPNNLGQKFLRGYQISDANGAVEFTTIYPGWYSGRTVHMHYKVRLFAGTTKTYEFTSQVMFDDNLTDIVFQQSPYNTRGTRNTRNSNDNIYQSGGSTLLLNVTSDGTGGYTTSYDVSLSGLPASVSTVTAVSGASYAQGGAVAPDGIASLFGNGLAVTTAAASTIPLPKILGDTSVIVKDANNTTREAELFYVSPSQLNVLIPSGTSAGTATITALQSGTAVASGTVTVANVAPGLFSANADATGVVAGYIQRIKSDGSQSLESILTYDTTAKKYIASAIDFGAATDQLYLIIFGTGLRSRSSLGGVTCDLGGVGASLDYVGPQNFYAGLDQVNMLLPRTLAGKGEVNINLRVDGLIANLVTVKFS